MVKSPSAIKVNSSKNATEVARNLHDITAMVRLRLELVALPLDQPRF